MATLGGTAGSPLVAASGCVARCTDALLAGETGWKSLRAALEAEGRLERVPDEGWAPRSLRSPEEIPAVERAMLASLRSPEDGPLLDRWVWP